MLEVNRLYPQYTIIQERRQQKSPVSQVAFERRSGIDRRNDNRLRLDTTLTRDIFEVKDQISKISKPTQQLAQKVDKTAFTQNITKAIQSLKIDQFVKTAKTEATEVPKALSKGKSDVGAIAGVIGIMLGGVLASTFLGVAGIGVAIGLGTYFGGKILKQAIVSHLTRK